MRILIHGINFHPEFAGTGKYTGELACWLASRGHEIRVVTSPPHYPLWRVSPAYHSWKYARERLRLHGNSSSGSASSHVVQSGLTVFRCPIWVPANPRGVKRLLHLASFALSSWPAMLWQLPWRPELVLLVEPTFLCAFQALLIARCSRAKAWLHVQDFEVDAAFEVGGLSTHSLKILALAVERKILRAFDRVSTISDRMMDRLTLKGVDSARRILFPNWVDTDYIYPLRTISPLRKEMNIPEDTIVALYSGSMGKKYGLSLLLDVARRLSWRSDLHFVVCGTGPEREVVNKKARLLPNVSLLDFQRTERLNELLNLADIHLLPQLPKAADLVMPSRLTGMFASGRPVIATASAGTQLEAVVRTRGLVVPPGDLDAFASAIVELVENSELRLRLGQEARKYALCSLKSGVILSDFERAITSICQQPGERGPRSSAFENKQTQVSSAEDAWDTR